MEIKIAKTAGFCTGVQRAMNIVLDTVRLKKAPIYTYGPLIHNPQVMSMLEQRGIIVLNDSKNSPVGTVVIRAHGVPPSTRQRLKEKGFKICDATCPHVAQVQSIVKSHSHQGYHIIIIGDKGHAEVTGILGFAHGHGTVINSLAEIETLPHMDQVCVVAQTTQNVEDFNHITARIKERFPQSKIFNTICHSTHKRQEEALRIAQEVEAMIVVGGKNSANTVRLARMIEAMPKPTFHIEIPEELDEEKIKKFNHIGVTAGASTPNWIIDGVVEKLKAIKHQKANLLVRYLFQVFSFLDKSDLFIALGAFSICYAAALLQGITPSLPVLFIPALYVFAMYLSNHLLDKRELSNQDRIRFFGLSRYTAMRIILALISLTLALSLSINLGLYPFILLLLASVAGIIYSIPLLPRSWQVYTQFRRLKDIPASKNIFLAGAWASIAVGIPLLCGLDSPGPGTIVSFIFIATLVFTRSMLQDIRDIQGDRIVGRETLPIIIGNRRIKLLLLAISSPALILLWMAGFKGWTTNLSFYLSVCILFNWVLIFLSHEAVRSNGIYAKLMIDSNFVLSGLLTVMWQILI